MQSGALLVVSPRVRGGFSDRVVDIRVDDHRRPLEELRRVLDLQRSDEMTREVTQLLGAGDATGALVIAIAARDKSPDNDNVWVALARSYLELGQQAEALEALRRAVELNPGRTTTLPREAAFESLRRNPEFMRIIGG
jgi:uncharacterized Ntn-hydrolase superfamily protein